MAADFSYNRPKATTVNITPINIAIEVGEKPDAPTAIGGTGTTGILDVVFTGDADESGGADVQNLWKVTLTPSINSVGQMQLTATVTPVLGDGTDGGAVSRTFDHEQTADAWQTAAGRARQA